MKIYTGYFGKLKTYLDAGLVPVSIACGKPKWIKTKILEHRGLNPNPWTLKWEETRYTEDFMKKISCLDPQKEVNNLEFLSGGQDVVLLCWETPGLFCHRQLVASWLEKAGIEVKEFYSPPPKKQEQKPKVEENHQMELF